MLPCYDTAAGRWPDGAADADAIAMAMHGIGNGTKDQDDLNSKRALQAIAIGSGQLTALYIAARRLHTRLRAAVCIPIAACRYRVAAVRPCT